LTAHLEANNRFHDDFARQSGSSGDQEVGVGSIPRSECHTYDRSRRLQVERLFLPQRDQCRRLKTSQTGGKTDIRPEARSYYVSCRRDRQATIVP